MELRLGALIFNCTALCDLAVLSDRAVQVALEMNSLVSGILSNPSYSPRPSGAYETFSSLLNELSSYRQLPNYT